MAGLLLAAAIATLAGFPLTKNAEIRLLDEPLRVELLTASSVARPLDLALVAAEPEQSGLDFDLLGEAPPVAPSDVGRMRWRRLMLKTHQALGLALIGVQLSNTVVGHLNYADKFGSDANTNRYRTLHAATAWTNVGLFAVTGGVALFAPSPPGKASHGFDRVKLHKISMIVATAGMAAQGALGVYTANREGFDNQRQFGKAHLAIGYATLAALATGVGAIVF